MKINLVAVLVAAIAPAMANTQVTEKTPSAAPRVVLTDADSASSVGCTSPHVPTNLFTGSGKDQRNPKPSPDVCAPCNADGYMLCVIGGKGVIIRCK